MARLYLISIRRRHIACFIAAASLAICIYGFFVADAGKKQSLKPVDYGENTSAGGKLAIIIDDFGQDRGGVKEMMAIRRHLTFAVMPFLEFSRVDAEAAYEKGHEVIVHLPLEPNHGRMSWVGPRPIMTGMKIADMKQIIQDAFESVPHAAGANIHMGSKASGEEAVMSGVLDIIEEKGLYFVDSRTADRPIGKKLADARGVSCFERDIFIDEGRTKDAIKRQLKKSEDIILKKGEAIAIGHVGPEGGKATAEAISEMLPEFDSKNIRLVFVSELSD